jgi:hypothetical protein
MKTLGSSILCSCPRLILAATVAVSFAAGCNRDHQQTTTLPHAVVSEPAPIPLATAQPEHVTLTGCLQEGKAGAYILTGLNEPNQPDSSKPAVVAQEKLAAADAAYRLSSNDHQRFARLVGRRVRIQGNVIRPFDLMVDKSDRDHSTGTAGQSDEIKAIESGRIIRQHDLAQVEVSSIEQIANACGGHASRVPRKPTPR